MARRKITDTEQDIGDLPDLTEQQRRFVSGIIEGKTASDAYREAYDCSNSKPNTIWCEASKLRNHTNVSQWIAAARKAELCHSQRSLQQHVQRLDRLQELCVETGNLGAAVQAEQLIGKASGHYVDQVRDVTVDPLMALREIAQFSPVLAASLAKEHGLEWPEVTEH